ncbi:MAG: urease accessory protein UreE [Motiliproteus sp.]|nr:urease accessory protein UreE [Motiliproteus sp.]MCW9052824.1 urease accessory protein UreE [Motiliproteus sp.]
MLKIIARYDGTPATVLDQLSLPFDLRKRGRFKAETVGGLEVGVFIERGQVLQEGDLLMTECNQVIQVLAQPEAVVTANTEDWQQFSKVCYHLGNRHVPLQVGERWLRFQPDHVLQDLAELYGLETVNEMAPFMPENGAYGDHGGHSHGHSHDHSHDQGHDQGHDHSYDDHDHGHHH